MIEEIFLWQRVIIISSFNLVEKRHLFISSTECRDMQSRLCSWKFKWTLTCFFHAVQGTNPWFIQSALHRRSACATFIIQFALRCLRCMYMITPAPTTKLFQITLCFNTRSAAQSTSTRICRDTTWSAAKRYVGSGPPSCQAPSSLVSAPWIKSLQHERWWLLQHERR